MNYKLALFDVDGTLTTTTSGGPFRKRADDWHWLPGRLEKLQAVQSQGTRIAVCTNQGGVAFGYMEQAAILAELTRMMKEAKVPLGGLYVCYTHPKATLGRYRMEDERRKPGPGMLLDAMRDFEATPQETLYVGDRPEDEEAAKRAGCAFMWAHDFFLSAEKETPS